MEKKIEVNLNYIFHASCKENTDCITYARNIDDKEGSRIMSLYKKKHFHVEKLKVNLNYILHVSCKNV